MSSPECDVTTTEVTTLDGTLKIEVILRVGNERKKLQRSDIDGLTKQLQRALSKLPATNERPLK
jgi:Holliday junction resolvase RusA-like endonuclease